MNVNPCLVTRKAGAQSHLWIKVGEDEEAGGQWGGHQNFRSSLASGWVVGGRALQSDPSPPVIAEAAQGALR